MLPVEGAAYTLPTVAAGEFRLELRDAENNVVCATAFTVVGQGDAERSLERDAELGIKLARGTWNSGESLEASLNAAYTGAGLLTIERDRVLVAAYRWGDVLEPGGGWVSTRGAVYRQGGSRPCSARYCAARASSSAVERPARSTSASVSHAGSKPGSLVMMARRACSPRPSERPAESNART